MKIANVTIRTEMLLTFKTKTMRLIVIHTVCNTCVLEDSLNFTFFNNKSVHRKLQSRDFYFIFAYAFFRDQTFSTVTI